MELLGYRVCKCIIYIQKCTDRKCIQLDEFLQSEHICIMSSQVSNRMDCRSQSLPCAPSSLYLCPPVAITIEMSNSLGRTALLGFVCALTRLTGGFKLPYVEVLPIVLLLYLFKLTRFLNLNLFLEGELISRLPMGNQYALIKNSR